MKTGILSLIFFCLLGSNDAMAGGEKHFSSTLKIGPWRAIIERPDGIRIIFNFTTQKMNGHTVLVVRNGNEKLIVDDIQQTKDSVFIRMPFFGSGFQAKIRSDGNLEGLYMTQYGDPANAMDFTAQFGNRKRYEQKVKAHLNISGTWAVNLLGNAGKVTPAIGEFDQQPDGRLTGTFLTPTGDYRFLEGTVSGDSLYLSAFDGGHTVLFSGKIKDDTTIAEADFYSGYRFNQKWSAKKDSSASLPDSYSFTTMREGETNLHFRFPSTSGDTVSIDDDRYKNKVVLVQIMGSWCPNCMDETAFLSDWYRKNRDRGVEIIGLAYEQFTDFETCRKSLIPFQKRLNVQYPFLITGVKVSDEKRTEKTLPQLSSIRGFPTLIFIGRDGKVNSIETGFEGPGTGSHFDDFKKNFNAKINSLLSGR